MQLVSSARALAAPGRRICVAMGVFDGVHLGHQQVIRQTLADAGHHEALAVVLTFDRHPNSVVAPERLPPMIYSLPQRLRAIASLGCDATLLIPFDEEFSRRTGEEFIRGLARDFGDLASVCVGSEFAFGFRRSGDVALLRRLGQELDFVVHGLAAVALDGQMVSSTRIRDAIRAGQVDAAGQMLGRGYALAGEVMRGEQLGRKLGFPTANLDTSGLVLPPNGVYAAHARVAGFRRAEAAPAAKAGRTYRAVVNIGVRPSVAAPAPGPRVEAHLLDFHDEVYGQELEICFVERLRDERKFPSLDALKEQIGHDIAAAGRFFGA